MLKNVTMILGRFFFRPLLLRRQTQSRGMRIRAGIARLFAMSAAVRTTARRRMLRRLHLQWMPTAIQGLRSSAAGRMAARTPSAVAKHRSICSAPSAPIYLASNWARKFPHTSPAPGMAAVRNHHVMVLMSHVEAATGWCTTAIRWRLTREHVVSISGYMIVNPRGA